MKAAKRLLPIGISIILLIIIVGYAPWSQVWQVLSDFDLGTILVLILLSAIYYTLKVVRFWYMLKAVDIDQPLATVALTYLGAQPVSLLPAGEIYRCRLLERYTGVPMKRSIPTFTMQGLFEGAAMATVGLICALALGQLRLPLLILMLVVAGCVIAIQRGYLASVLRVINAIPFVSVSRRRLQEFSRGNQAMITLRRFPTLLALSATTEVVGGLVAFVSVVGLGGHINGFAAGLAYVIPTVAGFVSFLPGGFGVSEQSAIGVFLLSGTGIAIAVAATLVMRVTIVGMGLVFGGIAQLILKLRTNQISAERAV